MNRQFFSASVLLLTMVVRADAARKSFMPNVPFGPHDAKRVGQLRDAETEAEERLDTLRREQVGHFATHN